MTSIYKIAEMCAILLGRESNVQALTSFVIDAYSSAVKKEYYENRADGCAEIDGAFIFTFGKKTPLIPALDTITDEYYIDMPSSVLRLPNDMGISWVSFMKDRQDFIRVNGLWNPTLKANAGWNRQTYRTEESRMYFPKMNSNGVGNILLKLAVALDTTDIDEEINIPRSMIDGIVASVVAQFAPKPPMETKVII